MFVFQLGKIGQPVHLWFGKDQFSLGKNNFAYIHLSPTTDLEDIKVIKDICEWNPDFNAFYISPLLLFQEMVKTGKLVLEEWKNKVEVPVATEGTFTFETSDKIGAPWTVTFKNHELQDIEIDFVPAIVLSTDKIRRYECDERLQFICSRIQTNKINVTEFLGISLHKADSKRFEMDFHNIERSILHKKNFANNTIKLIKCLRNNWKGPIEMLSSHIIKTVVMEKTLEDENYWKENFNLEKNFSDCMEMLVRKIETGKVSDIFFPSVNLLEVKFKDSRTKELLRESISNLWSILKCHCNCYCDSCRRKTVFFSVFCLFCDDEMRNCETHYRGEGFPYDRKKRKVMVEKHLLRKHRWTSYSAVKLAMGSTSKWEMEKMLKYLECLSIKEREKYYNCNICSKRYVCECRLVNHIRTDHQSETSKQVLCPHCLIISSSKCNLLIHIYHKHQVFRSAAYMALQEKRHLNSL